MQFFYLARFPFSLHLYHIMQITAKEIQKETSLAYISII